MLRLALDGSGRSVPIWQGGGAPKNPVARGSDVYWCGFINGRSSVEGLVGQIHQSYDLGAEVCHSVAIAASGRVAATFTTTGTSGGVHVFDASLATLVTTISDDFNPFSITASNDDIFWTEASSGKVVSVTKVAALSGSPIVSVTAPNVPDCESVTASAAGVFWAQPAAAGAGRVRGILSEGHGTLDIAAEQLPRSVAADTTHVYWRVADGSIRRAAFAAPTVAEPFAASAAGDLADYYRAVDLSDTEVVWFTTKNEIQKRAK